MCFCNPDVSTPWCGKMNCFPSSEELGDLFHGLKDVSYEVMELHARINILEQKVGKGEILEWCVTQLKILNQMLRRFSSFEGIVETNIDSITRHIEMIKDKICKEKKDSCLLYSRIGQLKDVHTCIKCDEDKRRD